MKATRGVMALRNLRQQPLWRVLVADNSPVILGVLQSLLLETDKALPGSVLQERTARELDLLRASGIDLAQTAQAYIADWLNQGWITRHLPPGTSDEIYELTADTIQAIRFLNGILKPRISATESRLSTVISQLTRLAEETDANPKS